MGTLVAVLPVLNWERRADPQTDGWGLTCCLFSIPRLSEGSPHWFFFCDRSRRWRLFFLPEDLVLILTVAREVKLYDLAWLTLHFKKESRSAHFSATSNTWEQMLFGLYILQVHVTLTWLHEVWHVLQQYIWTKWGTGLLSVWLCTQNTFVLGSFDGVDETLFSNTLKRSAAFLQMPFNTGRGIILPRPLSSGVVLRVGSWTSLQLTSTQCCGFAAYISLITSL